MTRRDRWRWRRTQPASANAHAELDRRVRVGGIIILCAIALMTAIDFLLGRAEPTTLTVVKALQAGGVVVALLLLRRPLPEAGVRWLAGLTMLWATAGAAATALARHDVLLGMYISGAGCLAAAAFVPWGVSVQVVVSLGTMVLIAAAWWLDGRPDWAPLLGGLPAAPISILVAAEVSGNRVRQARADATLREAEERFRQVVERVGEVLWLSDLRGQLLYVSPAYDDIWGRPRAELLGDPGRWPAALHPADRERAGVFPTGSLENDAQREYRIVRPDGTVRWIVDGAFPIRDAEGAMYRRAAIARDVTAIHDAADTAALRELNARVEAAREDERRRVAREIHEVLAQVLTGLKLQLASLSTRAGDASDEGMKASAAAVDAALVVVRRLATSLRPALLDDLGLLEALRAHARQFSARTQIACDLELPDTDPACGEERSTALFRIFDEALSNVARHAEASTVRVRLGVGGGDITLQVDDDGKGFAPGQISAGRALGLLGMRERARTFGGSVEVVGQPGRGTSVVARIRADGPRPMSAPPA